MLRKIFFIYADVINEAPMFSAISSNKLSLVGLLPKLFSSDKVRKLFCPLSESEENILEI